ncbi:MAG: DUF5696 domain-containing protein [Limisphaerales bacterium]
MQRAVFEKISGLTLLVLLSLIGLPAARAAEPVVLETGFFRFTLFPDSGRYELVDKRARTTWRSNPYRARFGEVTFNVAEKTRTADLGRCEVTRRGGGLEARFQPLADQPTASLRVQVRPVGNGHTVEFACEAAGPSAIESVRLLDNALSITDSDSGYAVVPVREGLLIPADSGLAFTHRFDTFAYEGCHMEMLGVVKNGTAALVTWHDPYVAAEIRSVLTNIAGAGSKQALSTSLILRKSAKAFRIQLLGNGDYVTIAKAYRQTAKDKGWWVPWSHKLRQNPERAKLFGAINFKLWSALDRQMNEPSTREESVRMNWTFDEAAQVAEHLKRDLKLDRVLFILGGWIHRGYDNQHPDILPAAPECGGDAALADCARRVSRLGYPFCLHDNYQDIYRDSPSWSEDLIMRNPKGELMQGGHWAGGRSYLTCSKQAAALAERPQNLPAVKKLTGADAYFIDTTYAAGLQECFAPNHPLTRWDDMKWKQTISDYARGVFGIFGSECGREWAIPHSDFFEGLTGVSGHTYHDAALPGRLGATVVPLFEIVYRDCIAMYGKYGYDPAQAAEYVLWHISLGRPLNYHEIPAHLYWKGSNANRAVAPGSEAALFLRADHGWAEGLHPLDRFVKNTYEILSPLNELTAQMPLTQHRFLTPDRRVQRTVFGSGSGAVEVIVNAGDTEYRHTSKRWGEIALPRYGFLIESPTFAAFHAASWNGLRYDAPPMFALRSLDGKPLNRSARVRVFHAFGDDRIRLRNVIEDVSTERVITGPNAAPRSTP